MKEITRSFDWYFTAIIIQDSFVKYFFVLFVTMNLDSNADIVKIEDDAWNISSTVLVTM